MIVTVYIIILKLQIKHFPILNLPSFQWFWSFMVNVGFLIGPSSEDLWKLKQCCWWGINELRWAVKSVFTWSLNAVRMLQHSSRQPLEAWHAFDEVKAALDNLIARRLTKSQNRWSLPVCTALYRLISDMTTSDTILGSPQFWSKWFHADFRLVLTPSTNFAGSGD